MQFFHNSWDEVLEDVFQEPQFIELMEKVYVQYKNYNVFPPKERLFSAFKLTPYDKVKVVILGQDPYHGKGQAHGVAFSVLPGVKLPPSLKNIYTEIKSDIGCNMTNNGCLTNWAKQGVFLLNSVLTVREGSPGSHKDLGWHWFTDLVIKKLSDRKEKIIFLLWGSYAISKKKLINENSHIVLCAPHPSPLSAHSGFFGCKHFSMVNKILKSWGESEINWKN